VIPNEFELVKVDNGWILTVTETGKQSVHHMLEEVMEEIKGMTATKEAETRPVRSHMFHQFMG
tara:strand:- start:1046 stop:1234 length:189 start_codon:yes stop_codon:yes gene_type:complete